MVPPLRKLTMTDLVALEPMAAINEAVADIAEAAVTADRCRRQLESFDGDPRTVEDARTCWERMLPALAAVDEAHCALLATLGPVRFPLTHGQAAEMVAVLLGALAKKKTDASDAAIALAACCDLFNPINEGLALWEPVSRHPAVLALAVKRLIASTVFAPVPAELLSTMREVEAKLRGLTFATGRWLERFRKADAVMFERDRRAWEAGYARLGSTASLAALSHIDIAEPRCLALERVWDRLQAAEQRCITASETKRIGKPKEQ
jgi:hypothetical protein